MTRQPPVYDADVEALLADTAEELFERHAGVDALRELGQSGWSQALWERAEEIGLPFLEVPEALGGAGGSVAHVAAVVRASGRHLAQIPLGTTATAAWALAQAEMTAPGTPIALAISDEGTETRFRSVPHARNAQLLVALYRDRLALVPRSSLNVEPAENIAGEPRDHISFVAADAEEHALPEGVREGAELRLALARAAEIAGALSAVERLSLEHVRTRVQFGIPIGRLPVVRDRLAILAEEVAAANATVDVARFALAVGGGEIAVAAAKVRTAEAATVVARIAHQLHGAIGVTIEHSLQLYTRRLWAWRDEDGGEQLWARRLGQALSRPGAWHRVVEEAPV